MADGGYDEGYSTCSCFWGSAPAEMVTAAARLFDARDGRRALDLGCGEGKNAAELARHGFDVVAVDTSELAIENAREAHPNMPVQWHVSDLRDFALAPGSFDLIIATGSLHCLSTCREIEEAILKIQVGTRIGGLNVIYSFNDGPQDMHGHAESFKPTLISHQRYLDLYEGWSIVRDTNVVQSDRHPHNNIDHSHSITRLLARKAKEL